MTEQNSIVCVTAYRRTRPGDDILVTRFIDLEMIEKCPAIKEESCRIFRMIFLGETNGFKKKDLSIQETFVCAFDSLRVFVEDVDCLYRFIHTGDIRRGTMEDFEKEKLYKFGIFLENTIETTL